MDKWGALHVRKKIINFAVRYLNRLIPDRTPKYPQTKLLEHVYVKLLHTYKLEAFCGRFDDVLFQTLEALKDRHFLNVLELSRKLLVYLGDTDGYYRQWLGLAFLLMEEELKDLRQSITYEDFLALVRAQWDFDMRGAFSKEYFEAHREELFKILFTNSLMNLT